MERKTCYKATKYNPDFTKTRPGRGLKLIKNSGRYTFVITIVAVSIQLEAVKDWVADTAVEVAHIFQGVGVFAYGISGILIAIKTAKNRLEMGRKIIQYSAAILGITANACRDHVPTAEPISYIEVVAGATWALCGIPDLIEALAGFIRNVPWVTREYDEYEHLSQGSGDNF